MGSKTGIAWTDSSWNPTTGCEHVSAGCDHCYAEVQAEKMQARGVKKYAHGFAFTVHRDAFGIPIRWQEPRRIFVNSMSDLFFRQMPIADLDTLFAIMALCPQHIFQILTKRPQIAYKYLAHPGVRERVCGILEDVALTHLTNAEKGRARLKAAYTMLESWPLPNVWLGTSVEDQRVAHRITPLLLAPAKIHFLSCEPLIGPLVLGGGALDRVRGKVDWVIVGGESGKDFRPMDLDWARALRDECAAHGTAFFFKQSASYRSGQGATLDGVEHHAFPVVE